MCVGLSSPSQSTVGHALHAIFISIGETFQRADIFQFCRLLTDFVVPVSVCPRAKAKDKREREMLRHKRERETFSSSPSTVCVCWPSSRPNS